MKPACASLRSRAEHGSVLIIVLWVAFGLVALALYFAHSVSFELRAADNRVASVEAEQAIEGAARYVSNILATVRDKGMLPDPLNYQCESVPVGDATFWLIGRSLEPETSSRVVFGLVDEASKLHLNVAASNQLYYLPNMTAELIAAITDWRDSDDEVTQGGAESQIYLRRTPPYRCKNGNFESVDELRMVLGMDLYALYGDDANLNGFVDLNENDGETSPPPDNRDGRCDAGFFDYFTVYSRQPGLGTNINNQAQLRALLELKFGSNRANQILTQARATNFNSVLEFYVRSQMSQQEFIQIEGDLIVGTTPVEGLVNINTASETVLACIPGIGTDKASTVVANRRSNTGQLDTVAWLKEVIEEADAITAGRYVTGRTYQFCADIAAVGHYSRGYRRVRFIFDTSNGTPVIIARQDLTHLGWALGNEVRENLLALNKRP